MGDNQCPVGGGPGSSGSGSVSSGTVVAEEKSRGSGGPCFSSSMQSKQRMTHRSHHPFPRSYSLFQMRSSHPLQNAQSLCVSCICVSNSSRVYHLFLSGEFFMSQT